MDRFDLVEWMRKGRIRRSGIDMPKTLMIPAILTLLLASGVCGAEPRDADAPIATFAEVPVRGDDYRVRYFIELKSEPSTSFTMLLHPQVIISGVEFQLSRGIRVAMDYRKVQLSEPIGKGKQIMVKVEFNEPCKSANLFLTPNHPGSFHVSEHLVHTK